MVNYFKKMMEKLAAKEPNPARLAWSISLGLFVAFSPYLGIQTILLFVLAFLFRLNGAVACIVLYAINNPWTMVPIAALDYLVGRWLLETVMGFNMEQYDPAWMGWVNQKLSGVTAYIGIEKLCFWCYFIGGNIIALLIMVACYPFVKKMCTRLVQTYATAQIQE